MRLKEKVAIITGGAQGIGKTTALRFAAEGAKVAIIDMNEEKGRMVVDEIEKSGNKGLYLKADVTSLKETDDFAKLVKSVFGKIDILINNAGITKDATLAKMTEEQFDQVINVNLKGVFNCTKSVAPIMIENGYGRIINASSVVALNGNFGQTNYVASKSGIIGMTKVWARELGRKGITVNAIAPGFIATDMIASVPEKVINTIKERTSLQRLGQPDDIANAYLFLASDEAAFITGTLISVDGGLIW